MKIPKKRKLGEMLAFWQKLLSLLKLKTNCVEFCKREKSAEVLKIITEIWNAGERFVKISKKLTLKKYALVKRPGC